VRRAFPDGITWLEAGPGHDPVALLADLARRLGLPETVAGFATIGQGRDQLAAALRGKRVLIAVDNVWDRGPLDALTGLAPTCAVLFTTRVPDLATTVGAAPILVDELTQEQALELLGRWTGQAPAVLPETARMLCTRVGNLALDVAMAGAMVARGRSFTDVLDLIELDLTRVRADLDPAYPYRTLFAAIEAGITDLPEDSQRGYAQLAVFAGRGPFPRAAARALWQPELPDAEVGDLLAELTGRSLLTAAGQDWYAAHDLQYEVLAHRLGPAGLAAAHARLLAGYRLRYPSGWAGSAADPYLARTLAGHLHDAGLAGELHTLLTDAAWIQARLSHGQLPDLIPDYSYAQDPLPRQILRALRRSAAALAIDPGQVRGQLAGRLMGHPDPEIAAWARGLTRQRGPGAWLAPLTPALTPTTDPLQQILRGHIGEVLSVAVTADGATAVSGATEISGGATTIGGWPDRSVRVWDLATGREQAELTGHGGDVLSVAVTADGATAVSGGQDGSVRVWDLATGRQQAKLTGHTGGGLSVAVAADATTAVSGGADGSVRVWNLGTGTQVARWDGTTPSPGVPHCPAGPGTSRITRRTAAISWVTVSWVATASSSTVESSARRCLPASTPVAATTCRTLKNSRFGSAERASRRRK
jgi:NB-ARC domain/WD domain, G-beta repeat/APAF-1 helical domain